MIEFKYDENGVLQAYRDGKKVGIIQTMGDEVKSDGGEDAPQNHRSGQKKLKQGDEVVGGRGKV